MIPKKPAPGLDPGWAPVFGKDHAPTKGRAGGRFEEKSFRSRSSPVGDGNAPRKLADLDRLDDLERGHVDDRDVVGEAVGGEKILLIRRERHVPNPLADQEILL